MWHVRSVYLKKSLLFFSFLYSFLGCRLMDNTIKSEVSASPSVTYSSCTEGLNASSCLTSTNQYVTSSAGSAVTGANGSLVISIPDGYYSGLTCSAADTNLTAANIANGVSIFGVTGSVVASSAASNAHRTKTTTQLSQLEEVSTHAGSGASPDLPSGYREVPNIALDDDGAVGAMWILWIERVGAPTLVERPKPPLN